MTVREYMNRAKAVQTSVKGYVDDIAMQKEDEIINLNITQMQDGLGSNDQRLQYPFEDYSGKYTARTVAESLKRPTVLPKSVGAFYNFGASGSFLSNFQVKVVRENKLEVYSTGTGTGSKNTLLTQTPNMYGLNVADTRKLNYEIIYPELMKFIKQYL
jgi:hypothetical protein